MRGTEFFEKVATKPPFSKLHPAVAAFFKDYLSKEKVVTFEGRSVLNTHFPPYPSRAFDNLVEQFSTIGDVSERRLYSVTLAVTNRCMYNCWHCYNAGRNQQDIPLAVMRKVVGELQEMCAVRVTLSGGEPLLRKDLADIAGFFDDRTYLNLNTTGYGLTGERADELRDSGIFAIGISIDSTDPAEHDRMRGSKGAFNTAVKALDCAVQSGLYPYIVSVATHDFLKERTFRNFMRFAAEAGAREVHLLEPCATGNLAGNQDAVLSGEDRELILDYQADVARDESLPILSSFLYLESPEAFGCGAGITHLYIDGSGEVSPCNLVPLSFGNVQTDSLRTILDSMSRHFCQPRTCCVGHLLTRHIDGDHLPASPEVSHEICEKYLPREHAIPGFFRVKSAARVEVGGRELQAAYNEVHEFYDAFWVVEAGGPVVDLVERLPLSGEESVFEAGCGTGFATVLLAGRLNDPAQVTAVDLSGGMLTEARNRAVEAECETINFIEGDALELLEAGVSYDVIFSSWVLGYIPLTPFFTAANSALKSGGRLAFVVHRENSPREPLEIFGELVARDPSILQKRVAFDFPRDSTHVESAVTAAGLAVEHLREGNIVFRYDSPDQVLEHLLKSGAGTAFYEAVDPAKRADQERQFVEILTSRGGSHNGYEVVHDYVSCIVRKP